MTHQEQVFEVISIPCLQILLYILNHKNMSFQNKLPASTPTLVRDVQVPKNHEKRLIISCALVSVTINDQISKELDVFTARVD